MEIPLSLIIVVGIFVFIVLASIAVNGVDQEGGEEYKNPKEYKEDDNDYISK